ncbi:Fic family protein [Thalassobacillus sp. C254]|uniref:Fic family protein n=1 Tax=Thalassobacillus sp. C254 TaxID=1225341 RepID=UPI000A682ACD|nr:Fic family protein [Thalassobacillus sp. C254]
MTDLLKWYDKERSTLHPVELATLFHFKFVCMHPFSDGNGRTARLLMNLILMKEGYPPAIVQAEENQREEYYNTLEEASVNHNLKPFKKLISTSVEESLRNYISTVS